jgi:hypothetical protein
LPPLPAGYYAFQAIAQNSSGLSATSMVVSVTVVTNVLQNGDFETGNFTNWTISGTPNTPSAAYNEVAYCAWGYGVTHSGNQGALLGDIQVATLSHTLWTIPGQNYLLSLWLNNSSSETNQYFSVSWSTNSAATNTIFKMVNPPAFSWINPKFLVMATETNSTLEIQAENDRGYFGLDDVFLTPIPPLGFQTTTVASNGFQLSWPTAPGVAYEVQYTTNLLQPNWTDLVSPFAATGNSSSVVDTNSGGSMQRFYRLLLP